MTCSDEIKAKVEEIDREIKSLQEDLSDADWSERHAIIAMINALRRQKESLLRSCDSPDKPNLVPEHSIPTHLRVCVPICVYYTQAAMNTMDAEKKIDPSKSTIIELINKHIVLAQSIWEPVGVFLDFQTPALLTGYNDNFTDPSDDTQIKSLPRPCDELVAVYYLNTSKFPAGSTGNTKPFRNTISDKSKYYITLCRTAWDYILAHEIGHLLFYKLDTNGVPVTLEPDTSNLDTKPDGTTDVAHHSNVNNLMHHTFSDINPPGTTPFLNDIQKKAARNNLFQNSICVR